jgi:hypothetical protein
MVVGVALLTTLAGAGLASAASRTDFSGTWQLDRSLSGMPQRGAGMQRGGPDGSQRGKAQRPEDGMRRGRSGDDQMGSGSGGEGRAVHNGAGPRRLPPLMRVTQTGSQLRIEDSDGTLVQEIGTNGDSRGTDAALSAGQWKSGRLEVRREGRNGMTMVQTFSLEDQGRSLVVRTTSPRSGSMPARDMKRVYRRVSAS